MENLISDFKSLQDQKGYVKKSILNTISRLQTYRGGCLFYHFQFNA